MSVVAMSPDSPDDDQEHEHHRERFPVTSEILATCRKIGYFHHFATLMGTLRCKRSLGMQHVTATDIISPTETILNTRRERKDIYNSLERLADAGVIERYEHQTGNHQYCYQLTDWGVVVIDAIRLDVIDGEFDADAELPDGAPEPPEYITTGRDHQ